MIKAYRSDILYWPVLELHIKLLSAAMPGGPRGEWVATRLSRITGRWRTPSFEWPVADLLEETGALENAVNARLNPREAAQKRYQVALAAVATRAVHSAKETI